MKKMNFLIGLGVTLIIGGTVHQLKAMDVGTLIAFALGGASEGVGNRMGTRLEIWEREIQRLQEKIEAEQNDNKRAQLQVELDECKKAQLKAMLDEWAHGT